MSIYNTTLLETSNNIYDVVLHTNTLTGDLFIFLLLFFIQFLVFITFKGKGETSQHDAFILSSLFTSICAGIFWAIGFIELTIVIYPFILLLIALFMTLIKER